MNRSIRLPRRTILIALVVIEAILALLIYRLPMNPGVFFALGGTQTPLIAIADIVMLALGVVVGALCHAWQGAIALATLAALPTVIQDILRFHAEPMASMNIVYLTAPLVVVGLIGWLLRYASAELGV